MTDLRYFRPQEGLTVRDPADGQPLPAFGKGIAWSSYWQRRLDDGDIAPTDEKSVLAGTAREAAAAEKAAAKKGDA